MFNVLRDISFIFPAIILITGLIRRVSPKRVLALSFISLLLAFSGVVIDAMGRMDCGTDCIAGVSQSSNWFEIMILLLDFYLLSLALKIFKGREAKLFMVLMLCGALCSFLISVSTSTNS